ANPISDSVPNSPPTATTASAARTTSPLRSSPSPVAMATTTCGFAALRSLPGRMPTVSPPSRRAPRQAASITPDRPPQTTTATSHVTVDECVQLGLGKRARHPADEERAPLQDEGGDRLHLMQRGDPRVLVDVELHDLELALALLRGLLEHRRDGTTGTAPGRP